MLQPIEYTMPELTHEERVMIDALVADFFEDTDSIVAVSDRIAKVIAERRVKNLFKEVRK